MAWKLRQSRAWIYWDNPAGIDYPHYDISSDEYFYFADVPEFSINFETYRTAKITVANDKITYFYLFNDETDEHTYWMVKNTDKVLKNGYVLNIELDIYLTYTRYLLKHLVETPKKLPLKFIRSTLTTQMLKEDTLKNYVINASSIDDPLINSVKRIYNPTTLKTKNGQVAKLYYDWSYKIPTDDGEKIEYVSSILDIKVRKAGSGNQIKNFMPLNLYAVLLSKYGAFHCYPVITYGGYRVRGQDHTGDITRCYFELETNINGVIKKWEVNLYNNLIDITRVIAAHKDYGDGAFLGVYRFPHIPLAYNVKEFEVEEEYKGKTQTYFMHFMYYSFSPYDFLQHNIMAVNLTIKYNQRLETIFTDLQDEILYSINKKKLIEYFKFHIFSNDGTNILIQPPKYRFTLSDGFLLMPAISNQFIGYNDCEHMGSFLPSPSGDYAAQVRAAIAQYNAGSANMGYDILKNIISQAGSGAAAGALAGGGVGAAVGAGVGLVTSLISTYQQKYNLDNNLSNALAKAGSTWQTSLNSTIWPIWEMHSFLTSEMLDPATYTDMFKHVWLEYQLSDITKQEIKQLYKAYGYPMYCFAELKNIWRRRETTVYYMQLEEEWIFEHIRRLCQDSFLLKNVSSEILSSMASQLANGIRIWNYGTPPNYD